MGMPTTFKPVLMWSRRTMINILMCIIACGACSNGAGSVVMSKQTSIQLVWFCELVGGIPTQFTSTSGHGMRH
ncbi:hypothetical protein C2E23DRAFT_853493 [Lenzites betulinus]|nr:hypothetical protein C2E23DRAFT_853493 [Lenzites betulinus]